MPKVEASKKVDVTAKALLKILEIAVKGVWNE